MAYFSLQLCEIFFIYFGALLIYFGALLALFGKSHRRRSLVGCSPWGHYESDTTEQLHFHVLEKEMATHSCSCLENPRDGGAWWAAIYGVAQNRTWLKRLSSIYIYIYIKLMLLNCGVGEDSWESLGLQGDPTSPFWRRSALGFLWKEWC